MDSDNERRRRAMRQYKIDVLIEAEEHEHAIREAQLDIWLEEELRKYGPWGSRQVEKEE